MHRQLKLSFLSLLLLFVFSNCRSADFTTLENDSGISVSVQDLDCCDDFKQKTMTLHADREVIILVHGCKASTGYFTTLKDVFDTRGQQAICFSYDYRDSIELCADRLVKAVETILAEVHPPQITIIGHSQGALLARRALISPKLDNSSIAQSDTALRLVTVSGPFNGIASSSHCGSTALHVLSLGVTALICQGIAGSTWGEINPRSDFINNPGDLSGHVYEHLKINTNETNTCRSYDEQGNCMESDFVFSMEEQYNDKVDGDRRVHNVDLNAGHAQVVGLPGQPPFDLMRVLEQHKVLDKRKYLTYLEETAYLTSLYQ